MRLPFFAALLFAGAGAAVVQAHTDNPAIDARRAYFTLLGSNLGPLAAMAKGEAEYDPAQAELHAGNLALLTGYAATPHFPEGSSNEDHPGDTRALPAIWSDFDGFMERYEAYVASVDALEASAGEGRAALGQAVAKVGGTCKACHDDFRAPDF
mgnify:CR=1 FL=1